MEKVMLVLKMLPVIIAAIKAIEEAIPGNGQGEQKLAMLRQILELADGTVTNIWPTIEGLVKVLVKTFNDTGVFKK